MNAINNSAINAQFLGITTQKLTDQSLSTKNIHDLVTCYVQNLQIQECNSSPSNLKTELGKNTLKTYLQCQVNKQGFSSHFTGELCNNLRANLKTNSLTIYQDFDEIVSLDLMLLSSFITIFKLKLLKTQTQIPLKSTNCENMIIYSLFIFNEIDKIKRKAYTIAKKALLRQNKRSKKNTDKKNKADF